MLMMCVMCTNWLLQSVCVLMMCVMCTMPVTGRVCVDDVYYACYRVCVC